MLVLRLLEKRFSITVRLHNHQTKENILAKKPSTVQKHQEVEPFVGGVSLPITFITGMDLAPEWDYGDRDAYLRVFWRKFGNDMLQSVLATVVAKIQTQSWELEGPEKLAEFYHRVLRDEADFYRGYDSLVARGTLDYYTQDNGWFMERQRSSIKDHDGPMLGVAHLDSGRMRPTGNKDYPFTYNDVHGAYHLMHRSQFMRIVDLPSPRTEIRSDVRGFCALSRTLSTSMIMTMLVAMKRERLADLPPSALAIFNNINRKQFTQALSLKGAQDDMAGNIIWRQLLPLFGIDPAHPASVQFLSLREVWESYDDATQFDIAAYSYAAGFRIDPREFWPVSQGPLGSGMEAEIQHQKAKAKSHGLIFTQLERGINSDCSLPKELTFKFVLQDADEEQQRAMIHQVQIGNIKNMQEAGAQLAPAEVRYLLTKEYKVIPQIMAKVPVEGEEVDLTTAAVYMDDVERQAKEYGGVYFGPVVVIDDAGEVVFKDSYKRLPLAPLFVDEKGGPGSGNWGHAGRPGLLGGSGGAGGMSLKSAVGIYSENWVGNVDLRKGRKLGDRDQEIVDALDAGMQPLTEDKMLYRGIKPIRNREQSIAIYGGEGGRIDVGHEFRDLGYPSTSDTTFGARKFADGGTIWRIHAKAGQRALDMGKMSGYVEGETLLPRGTKFKLIGRDYDDKLDVALLDLEIVTAGSAAKQFDDDPFEFGEKGVKALKTINQKIASLPRPVANQVRRASAGLFSAMRGKRRMKAIRDIPVSMWDDAEKKDELDEQLEDGGM